MRYDSNAMDSADAGSVCDGTGSLRDREPFLLELSGLKSDVAQPPMYMLHHGAGFEMEVSGEKRDHYSIVSKLMCGLWTAFQISVAGGSRWEKKLHKTLCTCLQ